MSSEMNLFQLAGSPEGVTYQALDRCLASIVAKGVRITSVERFSTTLPLRGYNVYIENVSPRFERKWKRIITRVVKKSPESICHRFRFSDWSY